VTQLCLEPVEDLPLLIGSQLSDVIERFWCKFNAKHHPYFLKGNEDVKLSRNDKNLKA
jgi:hypothetical protein